MAYTETTTRSYGSRLGGSLKGMLGGLVLFVVATGLLWWNEGNSVKENDAIEDAESAYVEMDNPSKIDNSLDGELIHASALATTTDTLEDSDFGVRANAINLVRKVEFYQWKEESHSESKDKLGGSEETTTTYTYKVGWTDEPINSQDFKDPAYQGKNTVLATVEDQKWASENVSFGAYQLPEFVISSLSADEKVDVKVTQDMLKNWEKRLNPQAKSLSALTVDQVKQAVTDTLRAIADSVGVPTQITMETEYVHVGGNQIYLGKNPAQPQIGDVRITYKKCSPTKCSIIAKAKGNTFTRYKAKNGRMFSAVTKGVESGEEMIQSSKDANSFFTWILRGIGLLLIFVALRMLLGFPEMLLKVVPFLSSILSVGVGIICFLLTIIWGGLVIALAWLFYRPILSICILAVVGAAGFMLWKYKKQKKAAEATAA